MKFPRKKKKAYIAKHGRKAYSYFKAITASENPVISIDVNGDGLATYVIADRRNDGTLHIHGIQPAQDTANAFMEFLQSMPKRKYELIQEPEFQ